MITSSQFIFKEVAPLVFLFLTGGAEGITEVDLFFPAITQVSTECLCRALKYLELEAGCSRRENT